MDKNRAEFSIGGEDEVVDDKRLELGGLHGSATILDHDRLAIKSLNGLEQLR